MDFAITNSVSGPREGKRRRKRLRGFRCVDLLQLEMFKTLLQVLSDAGWAKHRPRRTHEFGLGSVADDEDAKS